MEQFSNLPKEWKYVIGIAVGLAIFYLVYIWFRNRRSNNYTLPVGGTPNTSEGNASSNVDTTGLMQQVSQSEEQLAQSLGQAIQQQGQNFTNIIQQEQYAESQNISSLQSQLSNLAAEINSLKSQPVRPSGGNGLDKSPMSSMPNNIYYETGPQVLSPAQAFALTRQPGGIAAVYEKNGNYTGPTINVNGRNVPTYGQPRQVVEHAVQSGLSGAALRSYLTGNV